MVFSRHSQSHLVGLVLAGLVSLCTAVDAQAPQSIPLPAGQTPVAWAFSVDTAGTPQAIWWSSASAGFMLQHASLPSAQPETIALVPLTGQSADTLPMAQSADGAMAWAAPDGDRASLYVRSAAGRVTQDALPAMPLALAFAPDGVLHWVTRAGNELLLGQSGGPDPVQLSTFDALQSAALCVCPKGQAYVAAMGRVQGEAGVYLFTVGTEPVRLGSGSAPRIACSPTGTVHVAWRETDGLAYASSADWSAVNVLPISTSAAWAFTVDAWGQAFLGWAEGATVQVASSRNWSAAPRRIALEGAPRAFEMVVLPTGMIGLLWQGAQKGDAFALHYLVETPTLRQLEIVPTEPSATLRPGTRWLAISNLPQSALQGVRFYVAARSGLTAEAWQFIAEDAEGADGFAVQVPDTLTPGVEYHLIAQAELADDSALVAQSDWLIAESNLPLILAGPTVSPWRGSADVRILPFDERTEDLAFELWLAPQGDPSSPQPPFYLGVQTLPASAPGGAWFSWSVDSRLVPDGRYVLYATTHREGRQAMIRAAGEVQIDNACAPHIDDLSAELSGPTADRLRVEAKAADDNGTIARVDFYLSAHAVLGHGAETTVWLGSDADVSGGWAIEVGLLPEWRGVAWVVRAIAYDDDDYPSEPRESSVMTLPPTELELHFAQPSDGAVLVDDQPVTVAIDKGLELVNEVSFHLQAADGTLHSVGVGKADGHDFTATLDVSLAPVGQQRLVARVIASGREYVWPGPVIEVSGGRPQVALNGLNEGSVSGEVQLDLQVLHADVPLVSAVFLLRDADASVAFLGRDDGPEDGLGVTWDARAYLPGDYTLSCTFTDAAGEQYENEWALHIADPYGSGILQGLPATLLGETQLNWDLHGLPAEAVITLSYSPDDGAHWLPLAQPLASAGSFTVDASQLPDSNAGRLRLTWELNGVPGQLLSDRLAIEHYNDPPQVGLLSPTTGEPLPAQALVTWQASDPEGQPLAIAIAARQNGGSWIPIAQDLPNNGRYALATEDLPEGTGWELRVSATDKAGASREATTSDLTITHRHAPAVRLIWPTADAILDGETAILWSAFDFDGETLLIDLLYSDNGGQVWYPLAKDLPNTGYYLWETAFIPPGAAYRIRVIAHDGLFETRVQSDGLCSVGNASTTEVRLSTSQTGQPLADDTLQDVALVCWQTLNADERLSVIAIEARETHSGAIETVLTRGPLTGCALWDTLYVPDGQYQLVAAGRDADGAVVHIRSTLAVRVANLVLQAPEGEWLQGPTGQWSGAPLALRWRSWDPDGVGVTAFAEASRDNGQTWASVGPTESEQGAIVWQPSFDVDQTQVRIRLVDAHGQMTFLSPRVIRPAPRWSDVPDITLRVTEAAEASVAQWLVQEVRLNATSVRLLGSTVQGHCSLLADQVAAEGRQAVPLSLDGEPLTKVCALADNGLVSRLACIAVGATPAWAIERQRPADGADLSGTVTVQWQIEATAPVGSPTAQRLSWSSDGGQTWARLAELDGEARRYTWDVSALPTGDYRLRIEVSNAAHTTSQDWGPWHVTAAETALALSLVTPTENQTWSGAVPIRWSSNSAAIADSVSVWYRTAPNDPWHVLARGLPPSGAYMWDASSLPNGSTVWLRAERWIPNGQVRASTERRLYINSSQAPAIELSVSRAHAGKITDREACWEAAATHANASVRLLLSGDGGRAWRTLAAGLPLTGCQTITAEQWRGEQPLLRAVVTDGTQQGIASAALAASIP